MGSYLEILLEAGLVEGKGLVIPLFNECFADIANDNADVGVQGSEDDRAHSSDVSSSNSGDN
jgi:hypothetical protein